MYWCIMLFNFLLARCFFFLLGPASKLRSFGLNKQFNIGLKKLNIQLQHNYCNLLVSVPVRGYVRILYRTTYGRWENPESDVSSFNFFAHVVPCRLPRCSAKLPVFMDMRVPGLVARYTEYQVNLPGQLLTTGTRYQVPVYPVRGTRGTRFVLLFASTTP